LQNIDSSGYTNFTYAVKNIHPSLTFGENQWYNNMLPVTHLGENVTASFIGGYIANLYLEDGVTLNFVGENWNNYEQVRISPLSYLILQFMLLNYFKKTVQNIYQISNKIPAKLSIDSSLELSFGPLFADGTFTPIPSTPESHRFFFFFSPCFFL
jgi:hypothetical protein